MNESTWGRGLSWLAAVGVVIGAVGPSVAAEPVDELRAAAAAYAAAFNKADDEALADQWTERALLVEGGLELEGRDAIVASLRAWRERHPAATLAIEVSDVERLAEPLARVAGSLTFTAKPGAKPVTSRFSSLRVREGTTWRIAESLVIPAHAAALDDLDWLLGTWTADAGTTKIETSYEKQMGGYCLVGRSRIRPAEGPAVEALEVIHADRDSGLIRSWVFDSTGAAGEGLVEFDGTSLHKVMAGTPADRMPGRRAEWTQVIAPTGEGRCTMHSIERSVDGVAVPDGEPLHFRKVR